MEVDSSKLSKLVKDFGKYEVSVVGDLFLDLYHYTEYLGEKSLETGKKVYNVSERQLSPGAAGNVAKNLFFLGAKKVIPLGLVGDDGNGYEIINYFKKISVPHKGIVQSDQISTNLYLKTIFNGTEIERQDLINKTKTPRSLEGRLINNIFNFTEKSDSIILIDQIRDNRYGVVTERIRSRTSGYAKALNKILLVDSRERIKEFPNCITKINSNEISYAFSVKNPSLKSSIKNAKSLFDLTKNPVYVTLGKKGVLLFEKNKSEIVPGLNVEPIDITGAGDSFMAATTLALCSGASYKEAAQIGTIAAGLSITKKNTESITKKDILDYLSHHHNL